MAKRRGKGEGTILTRDDGMLMAQISIKDPITGVRKRPTVYGKTPREIQKKLLKLRNDVENGINLSPEKITLSGWIEQWLENYAKIDKREVTWQCYEMNFNAHIKESVVGKKIINKVTTSDLQRFYKEKLENGRIKKDPGNPESDGLSVGSVTKLHNIIRAALSQAVEEKLVQTNVAKAVKLPSERDNRKEITPLSEEKINLFLEDIKKDRYYTAYALELGTGMRKGELLGLKWEDINFEKGELSIKRSLVRLITGEVKLGPPKTKKSKRVISVPASVLELLKYHKLSQDAEKAEFEEVYIDQDFIFASPLGEWYDPNAFYHNFCRKLKQIKMNHVSFHTLRHSVATVLLEKGVNLKIVADLFGHASVNVTGDIYSYVTPRAKQDTANVLDLIIGSSLAVETKKQES